MEESALLVIAFSLVVQVVAVWVGHHGMTQFAAIALPAVPYAWHNVRNGGIRGISAPGYSPCLNAEQMILPVLSHSRLSLPGGGLGAETALVAE